MSWDQILDHPFVKDKITILVEDPTDSPFTHPLTNSQNLEKEHQKKQILCFSQAAGASNVHRSHSHREQYIDEPAASSRDSIHAILQSDLENFETDNDEQKVNPPNKVNAPSNVTNLTEDICYVTGNYNLIVNHLNDNLQSFSNIGNVLQTSSGDLLKKSTKERKHKNRDLEKRKLSQNLDNFSVRLGKNSANDIEGVAIAAEPNATNKLDQPRYSIFRTLFMLPTTKFPLT